MEFNLTLLEPATADMAPLYHRYGYGLSNLPEEKRTFVLSCLGLALNSGIPVSDQVYVLDEDLDLNQMLCALDSWSRSDLLILIENIAFMLRVDALAEEEPPTQAIA